MDENKIATLRHYASPYYDPVKAHEYYMRTRELKGRSTTSLNDEGKKVWSYTKNNIKTEKKTKVKEEQEKRKAKIAELREKAATTHEQITTKLKALNEELSKDVISQKESIDSKKTTEIERLMAVEIPSGLSKTERAKRVAERNEKIAKLRNDAKAEKTKISQDTKEEKSENTANAQEQRKQVSAELKTAVEAARAAYKVAKENLDSSYEEIYQAEFDKIASEYKKVTKTKSSSSSTKKSKPLSYYIRK